MKFSLPEFFRYPRRVREAARQMWEAIDKGAVFEVPIVFDRNDPTMQAVFLLQKQHKQTRLGVRQSRTIIVSHEKAHNLSADVKALLMKGGQMFDPEKFMGSIESMLAGHETFLREQRLDPEQMAREAKEKEAAIHAIDISSGQKMTIEEALKAGPVFFKDPDAAKPDPELTPEVVNASVPQVAGGLEPAALTEPEPPKAA